MTTMTDRTSAGRPRRRHPALGARIAATGLSTAAMLGMVAALGAQHPPSSAGAPLTPTGQVASAPTEPIDVAPTASTNRRVAVSELSGQPIQLDAQPVVRAAPAGRSGNQPTPVARTNGSR